MITLPPFVTLPFVRERLSMIFPESFPDRSILVGDMAARMVFVALYGAFVEGLNRYFRPSTVIRFGFSQAERSTDGDRFTWIASCHTPGYKAVEQWYADNTREPLRDDLIRNRAVPIGLILKREGVAPTSPAPIYCLAEGFSKLFDPVNEGEALGELISLWQERNLDPMVLQRMRLLRRTGVKEGQVMVTLPTTGTSLRLSPGEASIITKDVCETLLKQIMVTPVVVHVSTSDIKTFRELSGEAEDIGLHISTSAELPDIVAADTGYKDGLRLVFIEVVHSDGPITELRKEALLRIAADAGIPRKHVRMITAFEDRSSYPFKKRVSEIARDSDIWFRSEPELLVRLTILRESLSPAS